MMNGMYVPHTYSDFYMALAAFALSVAGAFLLLGPLARLTIRMLERVSYRRVSFCTLIFILLLVLFMTGWAGLFILIVATGIGLLPVMLGSRRMNCLSVILLPMACNMSGFGSTVAGWLGLL
jgi:putative membrane protein